MPLALLALTLSAFAIGTTEFVIVGLIPTIGADLNVSLPSAGLLVSLYALSVAIGAPLLTALTGRVPRKLLLVALMALFTAGNLVAWQAPSYESLIIARVLTGLAHGVFFSVGSIIATNLVAKEKAASAIATMFSGMTVAFVTGIPLGTFIGQHFGWRTTFLVVSAFGLIALLGSLLFVPKNIEHSKPAPLLSQAKVLMQPRLLLVYAMTAVGYGGSLIAFTYLAPILEDLAGFSPNMVGVVLLAYGVSVAFGNVPALQVYVVKQAEHFAPGAVDVAAGFNIAAFNRGVAGGSWGGGLVVEHIGLAHTPWIAALVVGFAYGLTVWSGRLDKKSGLSERSDSAVVVGH